MLSGHLAGRYGPDGRLTQSIVLSAKSLLDNKNTAMKVGLTVDLAIPLGFAANRGGWIKLAEDEAVSRRAGGGHALGRHIGKKPEELFMRLKSRHGLQKLI
ncbi:hypothetical protein Pat9b_5081 (plasmid) [Pantoea sp. At-9b]|nr:hypothetical protein Pat9b_5081 [Pantoea sp. At-9b]